MAVVEVTLLGSKIYGNFTTPVLINADHLPTEAWDSFNGKNMTVMVNGSSAKYDTVLGPFSYIWVLCDLVAGVDTVIKLYIGGGQRPNWNGLWDSYEVVISMDDLFQAGETQFGVPFFTTPNIVENDRHLYIPALYDEIWDYYNPISNTRDGKIAWSMAGADNHGYMMWAQERDPLDGIQDALAKTVVYSAPWTISAWVRFVGDVVFGDPENGIPPTIVEPTGMFSLVKGIDSSGSDFEIRLQGDQLDPFEDPSPGILARSVWDSPGYSTWTFFNSDSNINKTGFNHYAFTHNGSSVMFYLNGELVDQAAVSTPLVIGNVGYVGNAPDESMEIDEFRISNTVLSPAQIKTEYENQKSPGGSYTIELIEGEVFVPIELGFSVAADPDRTVLDESLSGTVDEVSTVGDPIQPLTWFYWTYNTVSEVIPRPLVTDETVDVNLFGRLQPYEVSGDITFPIVPLVDPVVGEDSLRIVIVTRDGEVVTELSSFVLEEISWRANTYGQAVFSIPTNKLPANVKPLLHEVQYWIGPKLLDWHVLLKRTGGKHVARFTSVGLLWYFTKRVFGDASETNYLTNESFEDKRTGWSIRSLDPFESNARIGAKKYGSGFFTNNSYTGRLSLVLFQPKGEFFDDGPVIGEIADKAPEGGSGYEQPPVDGFEWDDVFDTKLCIEWDGMKPFQPYDPEQLLKYSFGASQSIIWDEDKAAIAGQVLAPRGQWTASAWCYVQKGAVGGKDRVGMRLSRFSTTKTAWIGREGGGGAYYPQILESVEVYLDENVPTGKWVKMEAIMEQPHTEPEWVSIALRGVNGMIIWDEVTLTRNDGLHFVNYEQVKILDAIVKHAQDENYAKSDLNIVVNGTREEQPESKLTKIYRTESYVFSEHKVIADAISEFSSFFNGLDIEMSFDLESGPDGTEGVTRSIDTYFPYKSRKRKDIVINVGTNVSDYSYDIDGEATANTVIVLGLGTDSAREKGGYSDPDSMGGLVLEAVYNARPGSFKRTLDDQAKKGVERYKQPFATPQVTIFGDDCYKLLYSKDLAIGDRVQIVDNDPQVELDEWYRINEMRYDRDSRQISLSLGEDVTPYIADVP